jgi:hypothetical protein
MVRIELGRAFVRMAKPAGDLMQVDARLRQPGAGRVSQNMRRDVGEAGPSASAAK